MGTPPRPTDADERNVIEILILYTFCEDIGVRLRKKGRRALWFQVSTVVMWFVFELIGGTIVYIAACGAAPAEQSAG